MHLGCGPLRVRRYPEFGCRFRASAHAADVGRRGIDLSRYRRSANKHLLRTEHAVRITSTTSVWHHWLVSANGPVTPRQFLAHPGCWTSKVFWRNLSQKFGRYAVFGIVAVLASIVVLAIEFVALDGSSLSFDGVTIMQALGTIFLLVVMGGALVVSLAWRPLAARSQRRQILISVTNEALTVNEEPGVEYPMLGAKLGKWGMRGGLPMGTALHFQSGMHRFILGGRDHRLTPQTPLGAPDVGYGLPANVDAWVSASEFDQILDVAGLRSRLRIRPRAAGAATRCLLFTNPYLYQNTGLFGQSNAVQFFEELSSRPVLAIDIGAETIWVMDPNSNTFIVSAWRAEATATPTQYELTFGLAYGNRAHFDAPQMVVSGPSLRPLTIACLEATLNDYVRRFSWRGDVQVVRDPADYSVSGADWLTLVGVFGLTSYLEERF